jgi:hypothetical protein
VFVQVPLQFVCPAGHAHVPPSHKPPTAHECPLPQRPQYIVDVFRFVSHPVDGTPSQSPNPVLHDMIAHAPALHVAVALAREQGPHEDATSTPESGACGPTLGPSGAPRLESSD